MPEKTYSSVENLIRAVRKDFKEWDINVKPWFRGEPIIENTQLIPRLYRPENSSLNELELLRKFRTRAPLFVNTPIPQQGSTDQWLFLAQHSRLPTRLLDWTESLLVALFFALNTDKKRGVIWMLDPVKLNRLASDGQGKAIDDPLTWYVPELDPTSWLRLLIKPDDRAQKANANKDFGRVFLEGIRSGGIARNIGTINIRAAWEGKNELATNYPVAVSPTYIHPRISQQLSRFTVWGQDKRSLSSMTNIDSTILRRYQISASKSKIREMNDTLRLLGVSQASLFPDLEGLSADLAQLQ